MLAEPPEGGFGLLAWLLPLGALVGGAVAVGAAHPRVEPPTRAGPSRPTSALDPELERLVDEELARFDG